MNKKIFIIIFIFLIFAFVGKTITPKNIFAQACGQLCETTFPNGQISCDLRVTNTCGFSGGVCRCAYATSCGPPASLTACVQGGVWYGDAPAGANCCGSPPPPSCTGDGACKPSTGSCCSGTSHIVPTTTCSSGVMCGTVSGGGGGGGGGGSLPPPGSCGSCSGCYAPSPDPGPNSCALLSGVCSKAGFCSGSSAACTMEWQSTIPSTMYVGDAMRLVVFSRGALDNWSTHWRWNDKNNNWPRLGTFTPPDTTGPTSTTIFTATTAGTTDLYVYMEDGDWRTDDMLCDRRTRVTVLPDPSVCTMNLATSTTSLDVGQNVFVDPGIGVSGGRATISSVTYTSSNPAITVGATGAAPSYGTIATAVSNGSATITGSVLLSNGARCSDTHNLNSLVGAWWQVIGGNVTSGGSITSLIPSALPYLIKDPIAGQPGVVVYGDSIDSVDFEAGAGTGQPSSANWLVSSSITTPKYTYDYALSLLSPSFPFNNVGPTSNLDNSGGMFNGYRYYKASPGLTLNNPQNINEKVVLFVDGDLNINQTIRLLKPDAFFMAIVSGDINIDPALTNGTDPAIEGYFLTNRNFNTGSSSNRLVIGGSVVALQGINLDRDLGAGNSNTPGEEFRELPRLQLLFPPALVRDTVVWEEVAP